MKIKPAQEVREALTSYFAAAYPASNQLDEAGRIIERIDENTRERLLISIDRIVTSLCAESGRSLPENALVELVRDKLRASYEPAIQELPPVQIADLIIQRD